MFRPDLYRAEDAAVVAAREAAAEVLVRAVSRALGPGREAQIPGGVVAAWSFTHGLATLWHGGNLPADLVEDPEAAVRSAASAVVGLFG